MNVGVPKPTSCLVFANEKASTIAVERKNSAKKNIIGKAVVFRITVFIYGRQMPVCYLAVTSVGPVSVNIQDKLTTGASVMSKLERVLATGSREVPDCRCSKAMNLLSIVPVPGGDTEIRIFRCPDCNHELRLTIWHMAETRRRGIARLRRLRSRDLDLRGRSGRDEPSDVIVTSEGVELPAPMDEQSNG